MSAFIRRFAATVGLTAPAAPQPSPTHRAPAQSPTAAHAVDDFDVVSPSGRTETFAAYLVKCAAQLPLPPSPVTPSARAPTAASPSARAPAAASPSARAPAAASPSAGRGPEATGELASARLESTWHPLTKVLGIPDTSGRSSSTSGSPLSAVDSQLTEGSMTLSELLSALPSPPDGDPAARVPLRTVLSWSSSASSSPVAVSDDLESPQAIVLEESASPVAAPPTLPEAPLDMPRRVGPTEPRLLITWHQEPPAALMPLLLMMRQPSPPTISLLPEKPQPRLMITWHDDKRPDRAPEVQGAIPEGASGGASGKASQVRPAATPRTLGFLRRPLLQPPAGAWLMPWYPGRVDAFADYCAFRSLFSRAL